MASTPEEDKLYQELKALYPDLNDEQFREARDNLDTYIEQTMLQYERIRHDPEAYEKFLALTGRKGSRYDDSSQASPDDQPPSLA